LEKKEAIKMIAERICQFITQDGLPKPLEGRAREVAKYADSVLYEELINPSEDKRADRIFLWSCAIGAYLALC